MTTSLMSRSGMNFDRAAIAVLAIIKRYGCEAGLPQNDSQGLGYDNFIIDHKDEPLIFWQPCTSYLFNVRWTRVSPGGVRDLTGN